MPLLRLAALLALLAGTPASSACRLALALGLDVSGSVDAREYRLQMDGVAAALEARQVRGALLAIPGAHVAITVYEWGAPGQQRGLIPWTDLRRPGDIARVAQRLRAVQQSAADPSTGLGAAMQHGAALLARRADCWRHTLDISGDGPSNAGVHPRDVVLPSQPEITVNALIVNPGGRDNVTKDLTYTRTLLDHYRSHVLRGPGAFAETARTFDDYAAAMIRKLRREAAPAALSQLGGLQ